jgi:hypothetical protein
MEVKFRVRCLERLHVFTRLGVEHCFRGVIETAGLLALFEDKIGKAAAGSSIQRVNVARKFVFSSRKFGEDGKAVHTLDCVRALDKYDESTEELYDILCEAVHPNWPDPRATHRWRGSSTATAEGAELAELACSSSNREPAAAGALELSFPWP